MKNSTVTGNTKHTGGCCIWFAKNI